MFETVSSSCLTLNRDINMKYTVPPETSMNIHDFQPRFQQKVGSGTFETGFPPARFAAVWPLTLLAFGRYQQILGAEPPKQCQVEPFLAGWGKAAEIHGDMMRYDGTINRRKSNKNI